MIDLIIYATGYVLVSKVLECRRDKYIKDYMGDPPSSVKIAVLEPVGMKKHHSIKQPHIIK